MIFPDFQKVMKNLKMKKKMNISEKTWNRLGHRARCVRGHLHALHSFLEVLHAAVTEIEKITRLSSTWMGFLSQLSSKSSNSVPDYAVTESWCRFSK